MNKDKIIENNLYLARYKSWGMQLDVHIFAENTLDATKKFIKKYPHVKYSIEKDIRTDSCSVYDYRGEENNNLYYVEFYSKVNDENMIYVLTDDIINALNEQNNNVRKIETTITNGKLLI